MAIKVFLSNVRCAFITLGEPEDYKGNKKFRWSATALVPKTDKAQIAKVAAAIKAACDEKWGPKSAQYWASVEGDKKGCCWLDGDKSAYDGYPGNMSLAAHRYVEDARPLVYDSDKTPVYKADNTLYPGKGGRLFGGCYVNMEIEIWCQDNTHGKGLRSTLLGIQRFREGDAFGGGSAPNPDSFGEIEEGAQADDIS